MTTVNTEMLFRFIFFLYIFSAVHVMFVRSLVSSSSTEGFTGPFEALEVDLHVTLPWLGFVKFMVKV